jgi:hypothetical protein
VRRTWYGLMDYTVVDSGIWYTRPSVSVLQFLATKARVGNKYREVCVRLCSCSHLAHLVLIIGRCDTNLY